MRRRKIIAISAVVLLGAALVLFLLMRDAGPLVQVSGNLSAKDVAQIKSAVRKELWREVFPSFSWATIKRFPRATWRAMRSHVTSINGNLNPPNPPNSWLPEASVILLGPDGERETFLFTKGPSGWRVERSVAQIL